MIKKVVGIITLIIFITTLLPLNALAEERVNLEQISDKMPGDQVIIKGTTNLDEVTVKILRPNGTIMYVNVIKGTENGDFEDVIT
ncbi:MAG TPA: S-layer homology domain-containing protein, partial [Thermoanaerobacterales bacterium]|nr:S-layer homology domain-containing protein [Thermoanaerobacterales bacterium]